ncbi:MAG: DUF309 domain-containing protein [Planctomycetes bacterium]|nr:DUF309 domain-containing protein [Planctomycetota bacterium]
MSDRGGSTPPIVHGVRLFDAGAFWDAHEAWEHLWKADRGSDRHYLKGLIQYAAACHHLERGNLRPARTLLASGCAHLEANRSERWPFHTARIIEDMRDLALRITPAPERSGDAQAPPRPRPLRRHLRRSPPDAGAVR